MKRILSLVLCILMLSASFAMIVAAAVDSQVGYSVLLNVSKPKNNRETYYVGETVTVRVAVSTKDADGEMLGTTPTAPIYGFNGTINYDPLMVSFYEVKKVDAFKNAVCKNDSASGKFTFTYLCPMKDSELVGVKVDEEFTVIEVEFKVIRDGVSEMTLTDVIFTNKEALARPIFSSVAKARLCVGTGVSVSNAETLARAITIAKEELGGAVMNPETTLVYPAYRVPQSAYDAFDSAIKTAEDTLSNATLPDEFAEAERLLSSALQSFGNAKIYGMMPDDSSSLSGIIGKEGDLIELTAIAGEHGSLVVGNDRQLVRYGTSATVQAVPDEGYEVLKVIVNGKEYKGDDIVTIASVTTKTEVEFVFAKKPRFVDVTRDKWYFDVVEKIAEIGLFNGTSQTEFSPEEPMTRAMLVTVLYRLEGRVETNAQVTFTDVEAGEWYTDAVAWAEKSGIVNGLGNGKFGTGESISRQDMITILYRYLNFKGITSKESVALDKFADMDDIGDWAREALEWAVAESIIQGTSNTTLSPRDACTRAQVATIVLRYIQNIKAE